MSEHVAAKTLVLDLTVEADRRLGHVIHLLGKRQPRQELRAGNTGPREVARRPMTDSQRGNAA
ncbi:hypothetical protein GCM10010317_009460 [Streptomyces mirabilis]|nr:hypothetical protein GCM10010317_009460 [Streptomyces mirabilis]